MLPRQALQSCKSKLAIWWCQGWLLLVLLAVLVHGPLLKAAPGGCLSVEVQTSAAVRAGAGV
jgi:hypothetical protein